MADFDAELNALDHHVAALARAANPSETFRTLLIGMVQAAPRVLVLLVRKGRLTGWASQGYPVDAARQLRGLTLEAHDVWAGRALGNSAPEIVPQAEGEALPDFGQPPASEALALPVRVGGRPVAVIVAERSGDDAPFRPAALKLLVSVARLRLELDLAWRKVRGKPDVGTASTEHAPATRSGAAAASPIPPSETEATTLEPVPERRDDDDRSVRNEARRFAKLVATDIRLYNEEAVLLGRRNGDLARRLGDQLQRGQEAFLRRFPELGDRGLTLLQDAYVQVLAAGDSSLLSRPDPGAGPV